MTAACLVCNDTGSRSKSLAGYLDCTDCDVAAQRSRLNAAVKELAEEVCTEGLHWLIYQLGMRDAVISTEALAKARDLVKKYPLTPTGSA